MTGLSDWCRRTKNRLDVPQPVINLPKYAERIFHFSLQGYRFAGLPGANSAPMSNKGK
jgi:hypothetical protein